MTERMLTGTTYRGQSITVDVTAVASVHLGLDGRRMHFERLEESYVASRM